MQKTVLAAVGMVAVAGLLVAGGAQAAPLAKTRAWLESQPGGAVTNLMRNGITNETQLQAVTEAWDEAKLVDLCLRNGSYALLIQALTLDPFGPESLQRIAKVIQSGGIPPATGLEMAMRFPPAARKGLSTVLEPVWMARYGDQPALGRLALQYVFLEGKTAVSPETREDDLLRLLLAPEPATQVEVDAVKAALKERAIRMARLKLRAEGKSFVTKDGVNPLTVLVAPVVAALNAPACQGIEEAFKALGGAFPQPVEREPLLKLTAVWEQQIMLGDISVPAAGRLLGKIVVARGIEGYNRFVTEYNDGKAALK